MFLFLVGRPFLLYIKGGIFLRIAKAFWNHQHCWWFSFDNKIPGRF